MAAFPGVPADGLIVAREAMEGMNLAAHGFLFGRKGMSVALTGLDHQATLVPRCFQGMERRDGNPLCRYGGIGSATAST